MTPQRWHMSKYLGGYVVRSMHSRKRKSYAPDYTKIVAQRHSPKNPKATKRRRNNTEVTLDTTYKEGCKNPSKVHRF